MRIIDISHTLWGKSMAASAITSLIREYDEKQEIEQQLLMKDQAKFTESVRHDSLVMDGSIVVV